MMVNEKIKDVIKYDFVELLKSTKYPKESITNMKSILRAIQKADTTDNFFLITGKGKRTVYVTEAKTKKDAIKEISNYMNKRKKGMRMDLMGFVNHLNAISNKIMREEKIIEKQEIKVENKIISEEKKIENKKQKEQKKLECQEIREKMVEPTTALKAFNIRPVIKEAVKPIEKYRDLQDVQFGMPFNLRETPVKKQIKIVKTEVVPKGSFTDVLHHARETIRLITSYEINCKSLTEQVSQAERQKNDFMHSMELMTMGELEDHDIDMKLGKEILMKRRILHNAQDDLEEVIELKKAIHKSLKIIYERDHKLYGIRSEMFKKKIGSETLKKEDV